MNIELERQLIDSARPTQTVVAGTSIRIADGRPHTPFALGGNVTMTAVPTIPAGRHAQRLLLVNQSPTYTLTLTDEGSLSGSLLQLGAATREIAPYESLALSYDSAIGAWVEVNSASAGTGGGGNAFTTIDCPSGTYPVATSSSDTLTLAAGSGITIVGESTTDTVTIGIDAENIPFAPATSANWNAGVDPGDVDDALDQLAANLAPLLPPSAPVLDNVDYDSTKGPTGKNTWNAANTISGYANAPADSVLNAADALDVAMTATGTGAGIYAYSGIASKTGTLNEDVTASTQTPTAAYPADSFSPGGSDGGATNDLKILLNGSVLHTVDLLTFGSGADANGNGSGFNLSAATPVKFPDGSSFTPRTYRTGTWTIGAADISKGWNVVKIQQTTDSGTVTTNVYEFLVDDSTTATTYTSVSFGSFTCGSTKRLSGITYYTSTATATYACTVNNAYRNTYVNGNCITTHTLSNCSLSGFPKTLSASGGNEAATVAISETATVTATRLFNESISVRITTDRTVQSDTASSTSTISGILYDNQSATSSGTSEPFDDEVYRIQNDEDFNANLSATWNKSESLVGADAGHNTGLLESGGLLWYPTAAGNPGGFAIAPPGNPNYSAASGTRYYYRYFTNATSASNFRLTLNGSATLVSGAPSGSTNQIRVCLRLPTQTGWLDVLTAFSEGSFGSTSETATDAPTAGCYSDSLGSDQTIPTTNLGITFGTKATASSYDKVYIRIEVGSGWTGYLTDMSIVWGAT